MLAEYPFDNELLSLSKLYRQSRKMFLSLKGNYEKILCSTMRSLSSHDLFSDTIEYSPCLTELVWFINNVADVAKPENEIKALRYFNDISLFHEQNHRVIWRLLPPPPNERAALCRYLNFAEALVVTLDLALGDELGKKLSPVFERMNVIYRPGAEDSWHKKSKLLYREYLLSIFYSSYLMLDRIDPRDILKAVNYVIPKRKTMNTAAVRRGLELNLDFTKITNPQWQERFWKKSLTSLEKLHANSERQPLILRPDPLSFDAEFLIVHRILDNYGL